MQTAYVIEILNRSYEQKYFHHNGSLTKDESLDFLNCKKFLKIEHARECIKNIFKYLRQPAKQGATQFDLMLMNIFGFIGFRIVEIECENIGFAIAIKSSSKARMYFTDYIDRSSGFTYNLVSDINQAKQYPIHDIAKHIIKGATEQSYPLSELMVVENIFEKCSQKSSVETFLVDSFSDLKIESGEAC